MDKYSIVITTRGAQFCKSYTNLDEALENMKEEAERGALDGRNKRFMVSFVCEDDDQCLHCTVGDDGEFCNDCTEV